MPRNSKTVWRKGEVPSCEVQSVLFPKKRGGAIMINLTPRGARYHRAWESHFRAEQARIKRYNARHASDSGYLAFAIIFG